jgi:L-fuconate dehydratase
MPRISAVEVVDVRFPSAVRQAGSAASKPDGCRSAAYVVLRTDTDLTGHGLSWTAGRDTARCVLAARRIAEPLVGRDVDEVAASLGPIYRQLVRDNRLRRPDTESHLVQLAAAAVLNAIWDLVARRAGKPLWRLVAEMEPADLVAACDFRHLSDVLTPNDALELLERLAPTRAERIDHLTRVGYPAYTSIPGPLRYSDRRLRHLCREAVTDGWHALKIKISGNVDDDKRRLNIAREELGPDGTILVDAARMWAVPQAMAWIDQLAEFAPLWIEEPTSPDDIAGHAAIRAAAAPLGVATGGLCHDRAVFKQMLSAGALDYGLIDSCWSASVNEFLPVLLMAARFGVPASPRAGEVGPGELAQHMAMIDFVCVSGSQIGRLVEYVDVLHEHFTDPAVLDGPWYRPPLEPGYSARIHPGSVATYRYPDGTWWRRVSTQR